MLNYLVRLGWSHGDQEIFSIEEMIESFDLEHINASSARFDFEKLKWINKHYLVESKVEDIAEEVGCHFAKAGLDTQNGPSLEDLLPVMAEKAETLVELVESRVIFIVMILSMMQQLLKNTLKRLQAIYISVFWKILRL